MTDVNDTPIELPNGPAKVTTDLKKDRFKIDYAGDAIFQATVRVRRNGEDLTLKDAGARLFVVSKSEGWDVVTQSVRVTAVATQEGDTLIIRGHTIAGHEFGLVPAGQANIDAAGVYCIRQDWLLSTLPEQTVEWFCEEVKPRGAENTVPRVAVTAEGGDFVLCFRPHYGKRHGAYPKSHP